MGTSGNAISDQLWDRFGHVTRADLPPEAVAVGNQCILDWFGCTIAGSQEPLSRILQAEFGSIPGAVPIIGTAGRTAPHVSALINGAAGHAVDFDDTTTIGGLHSTAPIMPAAFAVAIADDRSGTDLLTALVVGAEIQARVGALLGVEHYFKGWHSTSSVGVFGATAAVAWLLGFDHEQFGRAIGLASSHANGLQANFGTMTKPFHAGRAAEGGYVSARLAAGGYTATKTAFEGPEGLAGAASNGQLHLDRLTELDGQWAIASTLFKYYAACHGTQATIESTLAVRDELNPDEVVSVEVRVPTRVSRVCKIAEPHSGLEAKFSLRGVVAMALLGDDTTDMAAFNDERINSPAIQALLRRVTVITDDTVAQTAAKVTFETGAGHRISTADLGIPASDLDAQAAKLTQKFGNLARPVLGATAELLAAQLLDLDGVARVRELAGVGSELVAAS